MAARELQITAAQYDGPVLQIGSNNLLGLSDFGSTTTGTLRFTDDTPRDLEWDFTETTATFQPTSAGAPAPATLTAVGTLAPGLNVLGVFSINLGTPRDVAFFTSNGVQYARFFNPDGTDADPAAVLDGIVSSAVTQIGNALASLPVLVALPLQLAVNAAGGVLQYVEQQLALNIQVSSTTPNGMDVTCFTADTLILTRRGAVRAAEIAVDDQVLTLDNGYQPVRWVGHSHLSTARLMGEPRLWPIRFAPGALGPDMPERLMTVSPQHRCLVRNRVAHTMTGTAEVLVHARHLLGLPGVSVVDDLQPVTYVHILLDRHEVLHSDGALTESLYLGPVALDALDDTGRAEVMALFPALFDGAAPVTPVPARPLLNGRQTRSLVERALRGNRPIVEDVAQPLALTA